jgi:hypothetical protein
MRSPGSASFPWETSRRGSSPSGSVRQRPFFVGAAGLALTIVVVRVLKTIPAETS